MKLVSALLATFLALSMGSVSSEEVSLSLKDTTEPRSLMRNGRARGQGGSGSGSRGGKKVLNLNIINEAFQQPFSPFFVMVHNDKVPPLYVRGQPASPELARLAEDGTPKQLVEFYKKLKGVSSVFAFSEGAPFFLGDTPTIKVEVPDGYYVTIASMAIHTNDCFVSINGQKLSPGMVLDLPGLDAGTEANNEQCESIPGPACNEFVTGNTEDGGGEGYVHVHRGFFGLGELSQAGYDWRNPMLRVVVTNAK